MGVNGGNSFAMKVGDKMSKYFTFNKQILTAFDYL